nr:transposase [Psychromonas hadalis]
MFTCLHPLLCSKTYKQLFIICQAMLAMTGRITMLSISRWTEKGGSYRTLQRFFETKINWIELNWAITKHFGLDFNSVILLGWGKSSPSCNLLYFNVFGGFGLSWH